MEISQNIQEVESITTPWKKNKRKSNFTNKGEGKLFAFFLDLFFKYRKYSRKEKSLYLPKSPP